MTAPLIEEVMHLRAHVAQLIADAPLDQLRTLAAYLEVVKTANQANGQAVETAAEENYPPVPASLVRPSDEELAEQLNRMRAAEKPTLSAEEAFAWVERRLA